MSTSMPQPCQRAEKTCYLYLYSEESFVYTFLGFFFFFLVLHQFCRYCPIDCSRIIPDLLQCMWEGKQTRFLQIYLSASYEGCNNCIYYSVELLGGYKNWCKVWIATIICREMHIKSFRKRFVFYKRPIGWYNNFQKWL